jgi:protoporphyrinogen oxidase
MSRTAIIIGAGPAGLTCALELLRRTDIKPIVIEASDGVGGIARTFNYKGNRIDIGGHRFFSKSDRVMQWWQDLLPLQGPGAGVAGMNITYHNASRWIDVPADGPDPDKIDEVMLVRPRKSRILYRGQLLNYPVSMSLDTLSKLGIGAAFRILASYLRAAAFPIKPERTLEEFFINRFGHELYAAFFRDYTEKVWGVRCSEIPAQWGAQRIKGLSLSGAVVHALKGIVGDLVGRTGGLHQKNVETSLIEQFLYPKFGPGQIWEVARRQIEDKGGVVHLNCRVIGIHAEGDGIVGVRSTTSGGVEQDHDCDLLFSTMPVKELVRALSPAAPQPVRDVSDGLVYRDFVTVGLLLTTLRLGGDCTGRNLRDHVPDNWIYVQEPEVKVGRLQFFNNWSPYMVADPDHVWIGLEYFCNEGDELWGLSDERFVELAKDELEKIRIIHRSEVVDHTVIRVAKTYPAYFGTYDQFETVRRYVDGFENLYLLGRNGMHRYNNQDHSMLTAMVAVDNIVAGVSDKENIWSVNTEMDYHEDK